MSRTRRGSSSTTRILAGACARISLIVLPNVVVRSGGQTRDGERERGPVSNPALGPDPATVGTHDRLADREAEPGPHRPLLTLPRGAEEALEELVQILRRDPYPLIDDTDHHVVGTWLATHDDQPTLRILDGIVEQVGEHLLDALRVGLNDRKARG